MRVKESLSGFYESVDSVVSPDWEPGAPSESDSDSVLLSSSALAYSATQPVVAGPFSMIKTGLWNVLRFSISFSSLGLPSACCWPYDGSVVVTSCSNATYTPNWRISRIHNISENVNPFPSHFRTGWTHVNLGIILLRPRTRSLASRHLEGWDVLYNIIFCYIANILLHNRNLFGYIAFNLMLYSICYITYAT